MKTGEVRMISRTPATTTSAADILAILEGNEDEPTQIITERIARTLDIVLLVAERLSNLRRTFVKALKNAVNHLREDAKTLAERTVLEETVCLHRMNSRLEAELKAQNESIGELEASPTNPAMTALAPHDIEELENRLMGRIVARLNARLEVTKESAPSVPSAPKGGKHQKKSAVEKPAAKELRPLPPLPSNMEELLANTNTPKQPLSPSLSKKKVPSLQPKLRAPKTAALVISCSQPGSEKKGHTYGQILADARAKINLSELGIEGVWFGRTLNRGGWFTPGW
ncbi:hypothetical protein ACJJTC_007260 [Scirpophaga incertulas]